MTKPTLIICITIIILGLFFVHQINNSQVQAKPEPQSSMPLWKQIRECRGELKCLNALRQDSEHWLELVRSKRTIKAYVIAILDKKIDELSKEVAELSKIKDSSHDYELFRRNQERIDKIINDIKEKNRQHNKIFKSVVQEQQALRQQLNNPNYTYVPGLFDKERGLYRKIQRMRKQKIKINNELKETRELKQEKRELEQEYRKLSDFDDVLRRSEIRFKSYELRKIMEISRIRLEQIGNHVSAIMLSEGYAFYAKDAAECVFEAENKKQEGLIIGMAKNWALQCVKKKITN